MEFKIKQEIVEVIDVFDCLPCVRLSIKASIDRKPRLTLLSCCESLKSLKEKNRNQPKRKKQQPMSLDMAALQFMSRFSPFRINDEHLK